MKVVANEMTNPIDRGYSPEYARAVAILSHLPITLSINSCLFTDVNPSKEFYVAVASILSDKHIYLVSPKKVDDLPSCVTWFESIKSLREKLAEMHIPVEFEAAVLIDDPKIVAPPAMKMQRMMELGKRVVSHAGALLFVINNPVPMNQASIPPAGLIQHLYPLPKVIAYRL